MGTFCSIVKLKDLSDLNYCHGVPKRKKQTKDPTVESMLLSFKEQREVVGQMKSEMV